MTELATPSAAMTSPPPTVGQVRAALARAPKDVPTPRAEMTEII
jgi:hypothetical protein